MTPVVAIIGLVCKCVCVNVGSDISVTYHRSTGPVVDYRTLSSFSV